MAIKNKAQLLQEAAANLPSNIADEISAKDIRDIISNVIESSYNVSDDDELSDIRAIAAKTFITTSGTHNFDPLTNFARVQVIGGGGGGGNASSSSGTAGAGGGGGAGGYSEKFFSTAGISSATITIGAGGAAAAVGGTSIYNDGTNNLTSVGGVAGMQNDSSIIHWTSGGAGGTASGGDVNISGQNGGSGYFQGSLSGGGYTSSKGGDGADSVFGGGALGSAYFVSGTVTADSTDGSAGSGYGSGGSGGRSLNVDTANGGAGAPGLVVITEYR